MTLKERLKAEETKIGKFLKTWVSGFLLLCSVFGGANEYLAILPTDYVPVWAKTLVLVSGLISYAAGKLSVKKPI
jgi:hypothetical protein